MKEGEKRYFLVNIFLSERCVNTLPKVIKQILSYKHLFGFLLKPDLLCIYFTGTHYILTTRDGSYSNSIIPKKKKPLDLNRKLRCLVAKRMPFFRVSPSPYIKKRQFVNGFKPLNLSYVQ